MKRIFLFFTVMLLSSLSFATSVDSTNAVTMLDYEQALNDDDARISLKNNTKELIKDICFNLTYIDMMGQTIDNENYYKEVYLSPGETKTITLPAFKADESYAYYRSVAKNDQAKTFIVKFIRSRIDFLNLFFKICGIFLLHNAKNFSVIVTDDTTIPKRICCFSR